MNHQPNLNSSIDLANLAGHLLMRWKMILAVTIIGAVIGGGLGYKAAKTAPKVTAEDKGASVSIPELPEDKKAEADEYYAQIIAFDQAADNQRRYNNEAYIMSLDPEKAVGIAQIYLLKTDIEDISSAFSAASLTDEDISELIDAIGTGYGTMCMQESVWVSVNAAVANGNSRNERKTLLTVTVLAPGKEAGEEMAKILDKMVMRESETLRKQGAMAECTPVDNRTVNIRNNIMTSKKNAVYALNDILTVKNNYINGVIGSIDPAEKEYINALRGIQPVVSQPAAGTQTGTEDKKPKSGSWYVVMGLLSGLFLSVCWFAILYLASGRVHTAGDIADGFGIHVMQTISPDGDKTLSRTDIFSKWGRKLSGSGSGETDSFETLVEELRERCEDDSLRQIYLAADSQSAQAVKLAGKLSETAPEGITFVAGRLNPDAADMKQLFASDGVVLIPATDVTYKKSIRAFWDICARNKKKIIGAATIA